MPRFFLSYRRDDSAGFAGRLADALESAFGADSVFRDVDDIRPGQDFVTAIESQLQAVKAVLVMIGPRWLEATGSDGRRRLGAPDDFVSLEVGAALTSGKPVIPLLVGGAKMPRESDLPPTLAGLARRQGVPLSDSGWRMDVERLVASLRDLMPDEGGRLPPSRRVRMVLAGLAVVVLLGVFAALRFLPGSTGPDSTVQPVAEQPIADVTGRWTARVKYDWGDEHDEIFEFKYLDDALHGTATYLTGRLTIEQARLKGDWLSFVTRSQEMLGSDSPWKEVTHRYTGQVTPEGIRFTLESGGGYTLHTQVEFVARRAPAPDPS
jgi:hypothetical protein